MTKRIYLLLFFACICTLAIAQKNKDFILTLSKDTIFGKVSISPESAHITFQHKRKKLYFHAKTLNAFGIYNKKDGYKYYKSIKNGLGNSIFVEILDEGPFIKLYKYAKREKIENNYHTRNLYYIGRSDKKLSTITPASYEHAMRVLVKDHPDLLTEIERISYKEVPNIVASLNEQ